MLKKTLIIILYLLLTGALCCYFIFSTKITKEGKMHEMCHQIKVVILDSAEIRFVSKTEIADLIVDNGITPGESKLRHINNYQIEQLLNKRTAVKKSEVSYTRDGILRVEILQRKPILRLETENGGFYMDENTYIFPLIKGFSPFVPVVSGEIPLSIPPKYNGYVKNNEQWANSLKELCLYISKNESWDSLIEQIYVNSKGVLSFIPRDGDFEIIFGDMDKIEYKFKKLYAFYKDILPNTGPEKYCKINLQFDKQIVCKKTNKNIEI